MHKHWLCVRIGLFVVFTIIVGCASAPMDAPSIPTGPKLQIVSSHHWQGEFEPCGCSVNPQGGIERTREYLESARKKDDSSLLYFVVGTTFRGKAKISNKELEKKANKFVDAFNGMGVAAFVPSGADLELSASQLEVLAKKSQFPWLLSNVETPKKKMPWKRSLWIESQGLKILVLGMAEVPKVKKKHLREVPFGDVLKEIEATLPGTPDLIVALSAASVQNFQSVLASRASPVVILGNARGVSSDNIEQTSSRQMALSPQGRGTQLGYVGLEVKKPVTHFRIDPLRRQREESLKILRADAHSEEIKKMGQTDTYLRRIQVLEALQTATAEGNYVEAKYVTLF